MVIKDTDVKVCWNYDNTNVKVVIRHLRACVSGHGSGDNKTGRNAARKQAMDDLKRRIARTRWAG